MKRLGEWQRAWRNRNKTRRAAEDKRRMKRAAHRRARQDWGKIWLNAWKVS